MRKALVVLLLLVTVIGMVFAGNDETSQPNTTDGKTVTLVMMIGEKPPVFNLRASSGSVTVDTNSGSSATSFNDGAAHFAALTVADDISNKSVSQIFEIFSSSRANTKDTFEFTIEATAFSFQDSTASSSYTTKGDISYSYEAATMVDGSNIVVSSDEGRITATFKGYQGIPNVKIGQIVVTWPRDPSAIPGEYNSDVTMTVKAK